jgi:hypothetical protein
MNEYLDYFCEQAGGSLHEYRKIIGAQYLDKIERRWKCYLARDGLTSLD